MQQNKFYTKKKKILKINDYPTNPYLNDLITMVFLNSILNCQLNFHFLILLN